MASFCRQCRPQWLRLVKTRATTAKAAASINTSTATRTYTVLANRQALSTRLSTQWENNARDSQRRFASSSSDGSSKQQPPATIVASNSTETEAVQAGLEALLTTSQPPGRWTLTTAGDGIERVFKFKTFARTWDFMTSVAIQCKLKNHHPEWSNTFNTTFVRWTTHHPTRGLTRKDIELAAICDSIARELGEQVDGAAKTAKTTSQTPASTPTAASSDSAPLCSLQGLADNAAGISGGDCCTPKSGKGN